MLILLLGADLYWFFATIPLGGFITWKMFYEYKSLTIGNWLSIGLGSLLWEIWGGLFIILSFVLYLNKGLRNQLFYNK